MFLQIEGFQTYSNILSSTKGPLLSKEWRPLTYLILRYNEKYINSELLT